MDFRFGPEDEAFRAEVRHWLDEHLAGLRPDQQNQDRDLGMAERRAWERELGRAGWIGLGWACPQGGPGYGQRTATLTQQVVFHEEYARSAAPGRVGHIGENLLAPTLLAFGTREQRDRFLPPIARGDELWCQGYSEPDAGSDLASLRTTAVRDGAGYLITGQKVWTSLAADADWCFVLARTPGTTRHRGICFLLVPMDQPGVEVRPIRQMSGTADFSAVYFDGARARAEHRVGEEGEGWRVAMGLLASERGAATLGQQIGFARELSAVVGLAVRTGAAEDPVVRDRIVRQWADLTAMRWTALRTLGTADPGAASVAKLLWGGWHQRLGELAMAVRGPSATVGREPPYELDDLQRLFLFSRADTIYGGSDEIQRNIIAERVLGLPREPRP